MNERDNILTIKMIKDGSKLEYVNSSQKLLYSDFLESLKQNQKVEIFIEAISDTGTNNQLAKIHACIRKLAQEIGYSFDEMKILIKREAGLCWQGDNKKEYCKSFADCSVTDLNLVIQSIIEIGDTAGVNFRGHLPQKNLDQ
mgnify:CR=1 FL=1|tara:strand:- start:168 stop:593 length:426 start_codon:yes stop_codon:yes gene_type:complete